MEAIQQKIETFISSLMSIQMTEDEYLDGSGKGLYGEGMAKPKKYTAKEFERLTNEAIKNGAKPITQSNKRHTSRGFVMKTDLYYYQITLDYPAYINGQFGLVRVFKGIRLN